MDIIHERWAERAQQNIKLEKISWEGPEEEDLECNAKLFELQLVRKKPVKVFEQGGDKLKDKMETRTQIVTGVQVTGKWIL